MVRDIDTFRRRFSRSEKRFSRSEKRFSRSERRFSRSEKRFSRSEKRLSQSERRLVGGLESLARETHFDEPADIEGAIIRGIGRGRDILATPSPLADPTAGIGALAEFRDPTATGLAMIQRPGEEERFTFPGRERPLDIPGSEIRQELGGISRGVERGKREAPGRMPTAKERIRNNQRIREQIQEEPDPEEKKNLLNRLKIINIGGTTLHMDAVEAARGEDIFGGQGISDPADIKQIRSVNPTVFARYNRDLRALVSGKEVDYPHLKRALDQSRTDVTRIIKRQGAALGESEAFKREAVTRRLGISEAGLEMQKRGATRLELGQTLKTAKERRDFARKEKLDLRTQLNRDRTYADRVRRTIVIEAKSRQDIIDAGEKQKEKVRKDSNKALAVHYTAQIRNIKDEADDVRATMLKIDADRREAETMMKVLDPEGDGTVSSKPMFQDEDNVDVYARAKIQFDLETERLEAANRVLKGGTDPVTKEKIVGLEKQMEEFSQKRAALTVKAPEADPVAVAEDKKNDDRAKISQNPDNAPVELTHSGIQNEIRAIRRANPGISEAGVSAVLDERHGKKWRKLQPK